jgi:hypothetical protein
MKGEKKRGGGQSGKARLMCVAHLIDNPLHPKNISQKIL